MSNIISAIVGVGMIATGFILEPIARHGLAVLATGWGF